MWKEIDVICGQTHTGTTCTRQLGHDGPHVGTDNWDRRFAWDAN